MGGGGSRADQARLEERNKYLEELGKQKEAAWNDYLRRLESEKTAQRKEYEEEQRRKEERFEKELSRQQALIEAENKRQEHQLERERALEQERARLRAKEKLREELKADINKRRNRVQEQLKPGCTMRCSKLNFPDVLNIGLFGTTGVGKTSLLNSLKYAVYGECDELDREQAATDEHQGGHTVRRLKVELTDHIAVIDNRGIGVEDLVTEDAEKELINQLEGRGSYVSEVQWRAASKATECRDENEEDKIYCTVLVFDARKANSYFEVVKKFVNCLHKWQGRFPIAVVTNIDRPAEGDLDNIRLVLRTAGITDCFEVANVTSENEDLEDEYQLSLLKLIERCMKDGDRIFELRTKIEQQQNQNTKN